MKKTSLLILLAAAVLSSCGAISQATSENGGQRFQDGIYSNSPSFRTRTEKTESQAKTDELIDKTKASKIYLFGEHKDSIMIPENFSARIQFDQKVGGTVVTVGENPYDWRWDLENNYGYYYGPYSLGSSWYWSRHHNPYYSSFYGPYWSSWSHNPWRYYSYYDPWYYGGYYGSYYDPWYYGGYYSGYWGWHDPWHHYHHHCGWYSPHHGPHHISHSHYTTNIGAGHRTRTETGRELSASPATSVRSTGSGTNRGSMSVGNRTARSVTSRKSSGKASTASSTVSRPSSGNRSSSSVQYRRPSSSTTSTASSSSSERSSSSSRYTRGSSSVSRSSSSSATRSSSSYDSERSSSYSRGSSSSYSRSSSSSYGGSSSGSYSRGSSSGSYSRGSSSGSYRR